MLFLGKIGRVGSRLAAVVHSSRRIGELCTWSKIDQVRTKVKLYGRRLTPRRVIRAAFGQSMSSSFFLFMRLEHLPCVISAVIRP